VLKNPWPPAGLPYDDPALGPDDYPHVTPEQRMRIKKFA